MELTKMPVIAKSLDSHLVSARDEARKNDDDVDRQCVRVNDFDHDVADLFRTAGTRRGVPGLADTFCIPRTELTFKPSALSWKCFTDNARAAARDPETTMSVLLVYQGDFSPFTKQHARVLKTARRALEAIFTEARVIGCLIVPHRDASLDFDVRDKVIRYILELDDVEDREK
eukprot:GEMP01090172.1.p1 GENE.GEMP01090172.1~~GEMP01090172.1.p1  ORF type:complete len:173 (+),score=58.36 GEMP01090172.1:300-818(+)